MARIVALLAFLSIPVSAFADGTPYTKALIRCTVATGPDNSVFAVTGQTFAGEVTFQFYFRSPSGDWLKGPFFRGNALAFVSHAGEYYLLAPNHANIYRVEPAPPPAAEGTAPAASEAPAKRAEGAVPSIKWQRTIAWDLAWTPMAAAFVAGKLWAFGLSERDIVVASLEGIAWAEHPELKNANAWRAPDLPARPETVLRAAVIAPEGVAEVQGEAGGTVQLCWPEPAGEAGVVRRAAFDGASWQELSPVPLPQAGMRVAVAAGGGLLRLFAHDPSHGITSKHPLLFAEFPAGGQPLPLRPLEGVRDSRLLRTHHVAAAAMGDQTTLILVSSSKLDIVTVRDGEAAGRVTLTTVGFLQKLETQLVVGMVAAFYFVALGLSLWRSRRWPRTIKHGETVLKLASWRARAAAFVVDMIVLVIFILVSAVFDRSAGLMEQFWTLFFGPVIMIPYFILLEGDHGQTLGKRLFNIATVTADLRPPGLRHVVIRNVFRLVEHPLVGLIVLLNLRTSQRLGDLFAGTFVIEVPPKTTDTDEGETHPGEE